jgi:hypothetical protein
MIYSRVRGYLYHLLSREIDTIARFSDAIFYWSMGGADTDVLFDQIHHPTKQFCAPGMLSFDSATRPNGHLLARLFILNGIFNSHLDIQGLLSGYKTRLNRRDRIIVILYNPYLKWLYWILDAVRLRNGPSASTFVSETDLRNLSRISGFEVVRMRPVAAFPFKLLGAGIWADRFIRLIPGLRRLSLAYVAVLRQLVIATEKPSLSIVVPARNERGNIENAIKRLPNDIGVPVEVIFVEGHSTDGTWEEIQRVIGDYSGPFSLKALKQKGTGKSDAARLGLLSASHDLLAILDADLTMPPELLVRFFNAYCEGHADFINGSRLVYPMEGKAMRFANRLGNVFFAKVLSYVLDVRLGDSLCGTKLFTRDDYHRMTHWRKHFGDFDPFGDFELLFPAAILGLGIVDIPIAYRNRTYGNTNIHRFRHGIALLKMLGVGFLRVKAL